MPDDLLKRGAELMLNGATLLSQPCPYCQGVRVMKEGNALCISCGREPEERNIQNSAEQHTDSTLRDELALLSNNLKEETDQKKQQEILAEMNSILNTLQKKDTSSKD